MRDDIRDYLAEHVTGERRTAIDSLFANADPVGSLIPTIPAAECSQLHRGPQGPNEDLAQCSACWCPTFALRPDGQSFGWHLDDCALPLRHEGYCQPGGPGHVMPAGWKLRG